MNRTHKDRRREWRANKSQKLKKQPRRGGAPLTEPPKLLRRGVLIYLGGIATAIFGVVFSGWYEPDLAGLTEPPEQGKQPLEVVRIGTEIRLDVKVDVLKATFYVRNKGPRSGAIGSCRVSPLGPHVLPKVEVMEIDRRKIRPFSTVARSIQFRYEVLPLAKMPAVMLTWFIECFDEDGAFVYGVRTAAVPRDENNTPGPVPDQLLRPGPPPPDN